jgi:MFS family permease
MTTSYSQKNLLNQTISGNKPPKRGRSLSGSIEATNAAATAESGKHRTEPTLDLADAVRRMDGDDGNVSADISADDDDDAAVQATRPLVSTRGAVNNAEQRQRDATLLLFPPERELAATSVLCCACYFPRRVVLLLMTAVALSLAAFCRAILSETVHAIKDTKHWSDDDEMLIDDAFVWGFAASVLVGGMLSQRYGFKIVLGVGVVVNALATMLAPFALESFDWIVASRTFAGAAEGVILPSAYVMMAKWTPLQERSRTVSLIWGASYLGGAVGSVWQLIIVQVEQQLGYALVYVSMGIVGVLWFAIWLYVVVEQPEDHKTMAQRERRLILDAVPRPKPGRERRRSARLSALDWLRVVFNWPVMAIIVSHLAFSLSIFVFNNTAPTFLRQYSLYPTDNEWLWQGLPLLLMFVVCLIGGCAADWLVHRRWHPTVVRQVFQLTGTVLPTLILVLLSLTYLPPVVMTGMTIFAAALLGLQMAGFATDVLDVSPSFAGVVMAVTLVAACVPQIGSAFLMPFLLRKFGSWAIPFMVAASFNLFSALMWALCASGRRTPSDHTGGSNLQV